VLCEEKDKRGWDREKNERGKGKENLLGFLTQNPITEGDRQGELAPFSGSVRVSIANIRSSRKRGRKLESDRMEFVFGGWKGFDMTASGNGKTSNGEKGSSESKGKGKSVNPCSKAAGNAHEW